MYGGGGGWRRVAWVSTTWRAKMRKSSTNPGKIKKCWKCKFLLFILLIYSIFNVLIKWLTSHKFSTPFLSFITLLTLFCLTDGPARILPWFLSFCLPCDKYSCWSTWRKALLDRESAYGEGTQEDRSTINFGHAQVRTPSACVPIKCFIHVLCPSRNSVPTQISDTCLFC